jgi:hypothetical protein
MAFRWRLRLGAARIFRSIRLVLLMSDVPLFQLRKPRYVADKKRRYANEVRLARMARERPPRLRDMHLHLDQELFLQIQNERRRYLEVPSFVSVARSLLREGRCGRACARSSNARAVAWGGPGDAASAACGEERGAPPSADELGVVLT